MKVKCINDRGLFNWVKEEGITKGKTYDVVWEDRTTYNIINDYRNIETRNKTRFEECEPDNVKVIRRLEGLNGLRNGMGLKILVRDVSDTEEYKDISISIYKDNWSVADIKGPVEIKLKTLKAMGFKFEYEPKRTLEEILESMKKDNLSTFYKYNFVLYEVIRSKKHNSDYYHIKAQDGTCSVGTYLFDIETARKYVDELNDVLGVDKNA